MVKCLHTVVEIIMVFSYIIEFRVSITSRSLLVRLDIVLISDP